MKHLKIKGNFEVDRLSNPHLRTTRVPFRAPIYICRALLNQRDKKPINEEQLFQLKQIARNGIIKYKSKGLNGRGWPHYYWCFSGGQVPVHRVRGKWVISSHQTGDKQ